MMAFKMGDSSEWRPFGMADPNLGEWVPLGVDDVYCWLGRWYVAIGCQYTPLHSDASFG